MNCIYCNFESCCAESDHRHYLYRHTPKGDPFATWEDVA